MQTQHTTTTVLEPVADPEAEDPGADTADTATTVLEPVADPEAEDPGADTADTATTVLEPVADRLPADPEAPAADWVAGINAAGWDFHRHLMGNTVSSPMSIGTAFSLSRAGASPDSGTVLDKIKVASTGRQRRVVAEGAFFAYVPPPPPTIVVAMVAGLLTDLIL